MLRSTEVERQDANPMSRVVHEHVDAGVSREHVGAHRGDRVTIGDIRGVRGRARCDVTRHRLRARAVDVDHRDPRALHCERTARGRADPARASRHHDDLVVEHAHRAAPQSRRSCAAPVIGGKVERAHVPGAAAQTAGIAFTMRFAAVAFPPPAAPGSPGSVPWIETSRFGCPVTQTLVLAAG